MPTQIETPLDMSVAHWFLTLRWGTILCQALIFTAIHFLFDMEVPLLVLWLITFEVVSNLVFSWLIFRKGHIPGPLLTSAMYLDIALLTALLAVTGGTMNPFTFLYLVHVVVGAILLPRGMAWGLATFSSICYGGFFYPERPLLPVADQFVCHTIDLVPELKLHLQGMWVAYVITSLFVVFFITRIQQTLVARREIKAQLREEQFKNERLASLATLSAGAAHEFATPLSTIAVSAGELYREIARDGNEAWLEDIHLIRTQVNRCRDILYEMAADAGEPMGEGLDSLMIETLVNEVHTSLDARHQVRLVVDCTTLNSMVTLPRRSVKRIIRGLISNALHASDSRGTVILRVVIEGDEVRFAVSDQGRGMNSETVARACEPFYTTKPAGQGLGLGLYLAKTLAERLGGGLTIDSAPDDGTTVHFWIKANFVNVNDLETGVTA